jgi:hypothetical protein
VGSRHGCWCVGCCCVKKECCNEAAQSGYNWMR